MIKKSTIKKAPNISLNLAVRRKRWELYIATFLGVLVQVAVLLIAGFASYRSGWNLTQAGALVQVYAYRECPSLLLYHVVAFEMYLC